MIPDDIRREFDRIRGGSTFASGSFTLAASPATSTVVARASVSSASIIHPMAYSADAVQSDITRIVPATGSFTVHHTASVNTRTYQYNFVTPQ